jgi:flagellar biosynthesis protein FlhA
MNFKSISKSGLLGAPILLLSILAMLVVPMPAIMLDLFFTFNIALALIIILSGIYIQRPLDFAAFPTVLLVATLLRLGLNIASTRVVLLDGHTGTDAAGHVIEAFGDFVIGGNYAVGLVVFSILVIINFVVVTKGAGRISEVTARFTLDSMPGKQMAVDADLNAGVISQDEAKLRRSEIVMESDFYGSMDGASKFVRGDAIAGILILFINIIGGLSVGMLQHDMEFGQAIHNYTLLTIGDGLVAQIPSLLLSTAAAIMVTRVSSEQNMGQQIFTQMFSDSRVLGITAAVMTIMGVIPGMPNMVFLLLAAITGVGAYYVHTKISSTSNPKPVAEVVPQENNNVEEELGWSDVVQVDTIGLEVGYKLVPLVDANQSGQLMTRIKGVRRKLTHELGFLIPPVHIRDNLELDPSVYRIMLLGVPVAQSQVYPERLLAINPGNAYGTLDGIAGKDPAFGMDAVWIESVNRDQAQSLGYTVVDPSTVIATHLNHILQLHSRELLGREEVQQLLDTLKSDSPKLVEGFVPDTISLGLLQRVLKNLLEENIPIRDMRTIIEILTTEAPNSQDPDALTAVSRIALKRSIFHKINDLSDDLSVITLDHDLERILQDAMKMRDEAGIGIEPGMADKLHSMLVESVHKLEMAGTNPVLLVPPTLRQLLAKFVKHSIAGLTVLAYNEIPGNKQVKVVATVGGSTPV